MDAAPFLFKKFSVHQQGAAHKVGTDGVLLGAWTDVAGARRILDIGTGTGVVALMLAQKSGAHPAIVGIDAHEASAATAALNFAASPWSDRLTALHIRLQDYSAPDPFDLIVSNPPFFSEKSRSPDSERAMVRSSGATLSFEDLIAGVGRLLAPDGRFCAILPEREAQALYAVAAMNGLFCSRELQVFSRPGKPVERLLICLERSAKRFQRDQLTIRDTDGAYTDGYLSLVGAFYPWCD